MFEKDRKVDAGVAYDRIRDEAQDIATKQVEGASYGAAGLTTDASLFNEVDYTIRKLRERFKYHAPSPNQQIAYETVRDTFMHAGTAVIRSTAPGPDRESALEALHIALMLANRAIALR
jgi:hypothetical protein